MDELATKLVDSLTKVETALEAMAPTAFQTLVEAAFMTGVVTLIWTGVEVFLVLAGFFMIRAGTELFAEENKETQRIVGGVTASIGAALAIISALNILANLSSETMWLQVLKPAAYVVKSLLAQ